MIMAASLAKRTIPTLCHPLPFHISTIPPPSAPPLRLLIPAYPYRPTSTLARSYSTTIPFVKYRLPTSLSSPTARQLGFSACIGTRRPQAISIGAIAATGRAFHTIPPRQKDHHFDTLKLVERLQREGFTEEQAVAMMNILSDVIEESIQNLTRTMVPQTEHEKTTYTQKVDFSQLRSDLQTHHSTEYQATRAEYERLSSEIAKLNSRLREEIIRAQNSIKLDLNLEKGRIREEASVHELKIKETDTRIETEVGMIRGTLEAVKFSTLQWLIGVCTGTAALILGVWRLLA